MSKLDQERAEPPYKDITKKRQSINKFPIYTAAILVNK